NPPLHMKSRKPTRLHGYDYSQNGYYFVTMCTYNRIEWFGKIENDQMILNECGQVISECRHDLPNHYRNIKLDESIIMPNHVHGIIIIENNVGNGLKPFPTKMHGLSEIIRGFKTFSSRRINEKIINDNAHFHWQKSFYDHVIRSEKELIEVREYIVNNPKKWDLDTENILN
ncbi:MAG: transposase, partial [Candidatus Omnitrophota bacterium]